MDERAQAHAEWKAHKAARDCPKTKDYERQVQRIAMAEMDAKEKRNG